MSCGVVGNDHLHGSYLLLKRRWPNPVTETRHILRSRTEATAGTLARAFADDPVMNWIFADPETRFENITTFMRIACERSISVGHAYEVLGGGGAALWCPPEVRFFTDEMGLTFYEMLQAISDDHAQLVLAGLKPMGESHPDEPHFYLADVGVEPGAQGNGYGATLVDRVLRTCDNEGIVAYLESSNPRNLSLYERAGFEVSAEIQLPEGPVLRPMVRQPQ